MTTWSNGEPDELGYDRYGDSPYYSPEKVGLEIVAELSDDESWEFNMVVVWRNAEGELRGAWDAGCSCPTPFGDLTWEGMKPIRTLSDLDSLIDRQGTSAPLEFIGKVSRVLR